MHLQGGCWLQWRERYGRWSGPASCSENETPRPDDEGRGQPQRQFLQTSQKVLSNVPHAWRENQMGRVRGNHQVLQRWYMDTEKPHRFVFAAITNKPLLFFHRLEEFLVPELQATEEEKSKLESGLTNGDEPMDQDLSVVPTKCICSVENLEIRSVIL